MKRCTVCTSAHRQRVEEGLQSGLSLRRVAVECGVGYASVYRHWRRCMGRQVGMPKTKSGPWGRERALEAVR